VFNNLSYLIFFPAYSSCRLSHYLATCRLNLQDTLRPVPIMKKINPGKGEKETERGASGLGQVRPLEYIFIIICLVCGSYLVYFWCGYFSINVLHVTDTTKETSCLKTFLCCWAYSCICDISPGLEKMNFVLH